MTEERKSESIRVGGEFLDYIDFVKKMYKEEYEINLTLVEITNIIAKRAKEMILFN